MRPGRTLSVRNDFLQLELESQATASQQPVGNRTHLTRLRTWHPVPLDERAINTALPMGFEPTISTLTGWRALRTAPRERTTFLNNPMIPDGLEPSIVIL